MYESLGVTELTLRIYRHLLDQPDAESAALAAAAACAPDEVAPALSKLRELKLLIPRWTGGGAEYAVHPNVGFKLLARQRRQQLDAFTEEFRRDEAEAELLVQRYTDFQRHKHAQDIEIVEGREKTHERMEQFQLQRSIWGFNPTTKDDGFGAPEDSPDRPWLERGIKYRIIYLATAWKVPRFAENWRWMHSYGAESRVVPSLPMRMMIMDGAAVVMALDPDDHSRGIVVHHSRSAVLLATELFESYWARGELPPQLRDDAASSGEISAQESAFLALLVQGATDEQAGRKLGVSLRTVRRMAAKLGEQVGASGRFELGVRAAQRGWVR